MTRKNQKRPEKTKNKIPDTPTVSGIPLSIDILYPQPRPQRLAHPAQDVHADVIRPVLNLPYI